MKIQIDNHYYSFDLLRVLLCLAIIILHVPFPGEFGQIIKAYTRSAVPVFFMLSGFLAYKEGEKKRFLIAAKKILLIGIVSVGIYFVWEILLIFPNIELIVDFINKTLNIKTLFIWILFNETPVGAHLWFLFALAYCHLIGLFILKKIPFKNMSFTCFLLIFINYIIQIIFDDLSIYLTRNWLLVGFPCYFMGVEIKKLKNINIKKCQYILLIMLTILGIYVEYTLLGQKELYLSSYFFAISVFLYTCVNWKLKIFACGYLSKLTLYIYITQLIILSILNKIIEILKTQSGLMLNMVNSILIILKPIWVFVICLALASIIYFFNKTLLSERKNNNE